MGLQHIPCSILVEIKCYRCLAAKQTTAEAEVGMEDQYSWDGSVPSIPVLEIRPNIPCDWRVTEEHTTFPRTFCPNCPQL